MSKENLMRIRFLNLLPFLLVLSWKLEAQKTSVSATEEQDRPNSLLLSVTDLDVSKVVDTVLFTVEDDYAVNSAGQLVQTSTNVTGDFISAGPTDAGMGTAVLALKKPLENRTYVLIFKLTSGAFASTAIAAKGTINIGDKTLSDRQLKLSSPVYLGMQAGQTVTFERSRAVPGARAPISKPVTFSGTVSSLAPDGVFVDLSKKLPAGQTSVLSLKNGRVPADGKIQLDAAPSNESDAYILVKANAVAAVHQAPVFTLSGSVAPFHPALKARYWGPIQIDPSVIFDVGLRSTKTANSVTVPAAFKTTFLFGLPKAGTATDFRSKATTNPFGLTLSYGPRYETDRTFHRVNLLGDGRADFYLPQLSQSVQAVQARASAMNPKYRDFIQGPMAGFQITPYLEFITGAHVNEETVTNSTTSVSEIVPEHSIARLYGGLLSKAQVWRFQLSSEISILNMFDQETIGYTTKKGVSLRVLSGIQYHTKPDFTFYLDPAHHFALDITYENGRSAPNFEYLNTVNAGVKVIY
jgi:hypothetical protein